VQEASYEHDELEPQSSRQVASGAQVIRQFVALLQTRVQSELVQAMTMSVEPDASTVQLSAPRHASPTSEDPVAFTAQSELDWQEMRPLELPEALMVQVADSVQEAPRYA
jgi:hypothetical protein